jgi:hypothetical protein
MIVVEHERAHIVVVSHAADPQVTRAQVAIGSIISPLAFLMLKRFAAPGAILPMGCYDYPFLAQRMPTFFPIHSG